MFWDLALPRGRARSQSIHISHIHLGLDLPCGRPRPILWGLPLPHDRATSNEF